MELAAKQAVDCNLAACSVWPAGLLSRTQAHRVACVCVLDVQCRRTVFQSSKDREKLFSKVQKFLKRLKGSL